MRSRKLILLGVVCAITFAIGAVVTHNSRSAGTAAPTMPTWVGEDGTIDTTKMPASFPVVGPDGTQVKCPDGHALRVTREQLTSLPDRPGKAHAARVVGPANGSHGQQGLQVAADAGR